MKYYFESKEHQDELKEILDAWLNTPFMHKQGVKGMGTDCIHYVGNVFTELGVVDFARLKKKMPDYPKDWHLHNTREVLKEGIEASADTEMFLMEGKSEEDMMNGDIILSHYGKASSHVGVFFNGDVYQALNQIGVKKLTFQDPKFRKQMKYAFRLKA